MPLALVTDICMIFPDYFLMSILLLLDMIVDIFSIVGDIVSILIFLFLFGCCVKYVESDNHVYTFVKGTVLSLL